MKGPAGKLFVLVFLLAILAGIVLLIVRRGSADGSPGGSTQQVFRPEPKKATVLIPSWADPIPPGKNVLWCASFQLAWDRLKADVAHGPISLEGADAAAAALNASEFPEGDMPPGSYYAAAGRGPEILARIREDMARLFPKVSPDLKPPVEIAAYAYLRAGVRFDPPYFDSRTPLLFSDGSGKSAGVNAFGIRPEDEYAYDRLRERVEIIFEKRDPKDRSVSECVIDPCRTSTPNQILLAMVPRKETLQETWATVRTKLLPDGGGLGPNDTLLVPNIRCEMAQDFESLQGRRMTSPGLNGVSIDIARQAIEFRLNRGGAELGSEAKIVALPVPTHYHFNRPFLVVMRKRGADHPYFLLWVDNREILE
jgi:hypothetical protein